MTIKIVFRETIAHGRTEKVYRSNRVTFPPELPYLIIGAFPKIAGKSESIFLPEIFSLEITD
jgi:hypothetical protein